MTDPKVIAQIEAEFPHTADQIIATPAAEPAPVAVEGACPQCNGSGVLDTTFGLMDRSKPSNRQCDCQWPRADLAPTGNTALVERINYAIHNKVDDLHHLQVHVECRDFIAALQPAAPQPTPEMEALRDVEQALVALASERASIPPSDKLLITGRQEGEQAGYAHALAIIRAALARGSVAEKGER